jgi:phosphohistidine phosphatase
MKTLYIIRHAKSSWDDPIADDFNRPLNDRGKRDAPRMGRRLKEKEITPDLLITSPAKRALATCHAIAEILQFPAQNIRLEKALYHANSDEILKIIHSVDDKHDVIFLFGHNPGLTDFANELRDDKKFIDNIPTCGVVAFNCNAKRWKEIQFGKARLIFFDFPKSKSD